MLNDQILSNDHCKDSVGTNPRQSYNAKNLKTILRNRKKKEKKEKKDNLKIDLQYKKLHRVRGALAWPKVLRATTRMHKTE